MKNLTLNEFNQSHEVAVEFKDANVEFRQILETLVFLKPFVSLVGVIFCMNFIVIDRQNG